MAYASLASLAQTLHHFLVPHQHPSVLEKRHIQSLHDKIILLSTFLEDFPREATKLEARITIAAYRIEDMFDYYILIKNGSIYGKRRSNVPSPLDSSSSVFDLRRIQRELQNHIKEIDFILTEAMDIKNMLRRCCTSESQMMSSHHSSASFSSTLAPNVKGDVVGFEKELLEIKERLYGESAELEVISIFGMGGIGKTTLARYALHDPFTLHHFDVSAFVSVSQNYDKATILLCLLNSFDASSVGKSEDKSLLDERVYKYLSGRRFLIVIDDIWNAQTWDDLRSVFPNDSNGSRIIITTREFSVAAYADSCSHPYQMHLMSVDLGWNLLRQKVFEDEQCPPELEQIGMHIAEKCRGLPLAIAAIAGVLSKLDRMQHTWKKIATNVNEAVNLSDEPFAEILYLSYMYLPHHLRPCFLYMGAFPEDEEIHVSKLIRLWVAEGFIKSNGSKDLEEAGEDYLEELAKRSLVLINKKRYNGKIKSIRMHDLLRDLCIRKADDEKFLQVIHGRFPECIVNSRRLSIISKSRYDFGDMDDMSIHTILVFGQRLFDSWKCCRLVRVVDLMLGDSRSLYDEICELLHLRYLAVTFKTFESISKVPGCFSKLGNLQTLIIGRHASALCLPSEIWRMRELRHIIVWDDILPDPPADQILPLEKLHTLKQINGFRCSKMILELIPNLKKLGIIYTPHESKGKIWSEYGLNNLIHLEKLEKLNLYVHPDVYVYYLGNYFSKCLTFPLTLKKLTLSGIGLPWENMSIVGSLPNLQVLKLKILAYRGSVWKTVQGQFCQLKLLFIDWSDPDSWITESSHFPRLERLILRYCYKLREIPSDIGEIATLQLIEVAHCNSSLVESAKYIEEEQLSFGNCVQLRFE